MQITSKSLSSFLFLRTLLTVQHILAHKSITSRQPVY